MLMVSSFKNKHYIFLNGVYFKELRILTRFLLDISQVKYFKKTPLNSFSVAQLIYKIIFNP
jgi:hypothetical protein